jgi:hypothetical protein
VPEPQDFAEAGARLYNHLPGSAVLGVKSLLAEALEAARLRAEQRGRGEEYDFSPRTYLLPDDFLRLQGAAQRMPGAVWIRKPKSMSRGRGVEVLESAAESGSSHEHLVQEYLASPHLLDGHKYSLRCYLLVTSLEPLCAWLFDDGFCKLASRPFSLAGNDKVDRFRHLTNPDVLKDDPTVATSSKNLTHRGYRARLRRDGLDDARLFADIRAILQKTLVATRDAIVRHGEGQSQEHRFELFGFDIAVDDRLRPVLIECNLSPSLAISAEGETQAQRDEEEVKRRLSREMLALLDAGAPAAWPDSDAGFAAMVRAQGQRAGGFERIVPAADTAALLGDFERPAPPDLALAAALGVLAPLRPGRTRAFSLGDGLVLSNPETGYLANLNAEHAALWRHAVAAGELRGTPNIGTQNIGTPTMATPGIEPERAERLATWLLDRFLTVGQSQEEPPAVNGWGAPPCAQIGGYRFALRTPGSEVDATLARALAPMRTGVPGPAPRAWDVVRDLDGLALLDPRGARRFRGEADALPLVLLESLGREAALVNGELGWLDAALVRRGATSALLLLPRAGGRALLELLLARGIERSAEPVHMRVAEALVAAASPGAPGWTPRLLVRVLLDASNPVGQHRLSPFEACAALFSSAPDELHAAPAAAARLVDWLAGVDALELAAPALDQAADALAALLG